MSLFKYLMIPRLGLTNARVSGLALEMCGLLRLVGAGKDASCPMMALGLLLGLPVATEAEALQKAARTCLENCHILEQLGLLGEPGWVTRVSTRGSVSTALAARGRCRLKSAERPGK